MCVALPGRIEWIGEVTDGSIPARMESGGHNYTIDLVMIPHAKVGDYVIAHSGYAIRVVETTEATRTQRLLGVDKPAT